MSEDECPGCGSNYGITDEWCQKCGLDPTQACEFCGSMAGIKGLRNDHAFCEDCCERYDAGEDDEEESKCP